MQEPTVTQAMIDAYDEYTHLTLDRRRFMEQLTKLAGSGAAAAAIAPMLAANSSAAAATVSTLVLAWVEAAATAREPHRIAFYLGDVAAAFHAWWNMGNDRPDARIILANDAELTATRLYLADGIGQVIRNGLHLMGVEALEEMA